MFDSFHGFVLCLLGFLGFIYLLALVPVLAYIVFGGILLYMAAMIAFMIYIVGRFIYSLVYYLFTGDKNVLEWV